MNTGRLFKAMLLATIYSLLLVTDASAEGNCKVKVLDVVCLGGSMKSLAKDNNRIEVSANVNIPGQESINVFKNTDRYIRNLLSKSSLSELMDKGNLYSLGVVAYNDVIYRINVSFYRLPYNKYLVADLNTENIIRDLTSLYGKSSNSTVDNGATSAISWQCKDYLVQLLMFDKTATLDYSIGKVVDEVAKAKTY